MHAPRPTPRPTLRPALRPARTLVATLASTAVAVLALAACGSDGGDPSTGGGDESTASVTPTQDAGAAPSGEPVELSLVGFAVPKAANNAIQAKFAETPEGAGVTWVESYGASGDQSRAVEAGLAADYVHFSLEGDVTRLVDAGLVAEDWNTGPTDGIVSDSIVVLAVRPGNPKGIDSWDDLTEDGIEIVTPNPGSSGSARWNIMAAYGHAYAGGATDEEADAFVAEIFENIVALPGSGRDATTAFLSGTGDVLLSYENEAILARQNGEEIDYVVPDTTLLIENPGAVLIDADPRASAWLDFVLSPEGQTEFAELGFRPVIDGVDPGEVEGANDPADPFPTPEQLLTIGEDFGGWPEVNSVYFDPDSGRVTAIQTATGKSS
jgi:sulfate/thiosulfate-binding protein